MLTSAALVVSGAVVYSVATAPAARAAATTFTCSGNVLYGVQLGAGSGDGTLQTVDAGGVGGASVANTNVALVGQNRVNGLGITKGGTAAYYLGQPTSTSNPNGVTSLTIYKYVPGTGAGTGETSFTNGFVLQNESLALVAGAVDPATGIYYYGNYDNTSGTAVIYGWNTNTDTPINGVIGKLSSSALFNGDLAFDSAGNMFIVGSNGTNAALLSVAGPLPTTGAATVAAAPTLAYNTVATLSNPSSFSFNGIAFTNTGNLYIEYNDTSAKPYLEQVSPVTGAVLAGPTIQSNTTAADTDLGSCQTPPSLQLDKTLTTRVAPTDQFNLTVTGTPNAAATTTSTGTGPQTPVAGPVIAKYGSNYTMTEVGAGTPAADLSLYTTTYECVDSANNNAVVKSGTGTSFTVTFPALPASGPSPAVDCTFTNTPTPAVLNTVKTVTSVNGAAATTATAVKAGDVVKYTVTTTNTGGATATTTLSDAVPTGTSYSGTGEGWSCAAGAAAGTSCTQSVTVPGASAVSKTYTVTVVTPLPAGTQAITNVVSSSVGTCTSCSVSNPTVAALSTIKTVVTVNGDSAGATTPVKAGDVLIYSVAVTNSGGTSGATTLSDPVPANTTYSGTGQGWSCATGSAAGTACTQTVTVAAGTTVTKNYTVTVVTPLPAGTQSISNAVTSTAGSCAQCTVTNPTVPVLDTVKTVTTVNGIAASTATALKAGDVVVYTVRTGNTGGSAGTTVLSDPVPANTRYTGSGEGWSCAAGSVAGTACTQSAAVPANSAVSKTYTVTVVTPLPTGTQSITNTVSASAGTCSACTVTNPTAPVLDTVKSVVTVNGAAATTATAVKAGDVIGYSIVVGNTGGTSGTTTLSDTVPANTAYSGTGQGWSCATGSAAGTACTQAVTVPANASVTKSYTVTVATPLPAGTQTVANVVTTSVGTCSACTVTNPTVPVLSTTKTVTSVNGTAATTSTQVKAGDVVKYTITVGNSGGSAGTTTVSDPVPAASTYTGAAEGWSCPSGSAAGTACTQSVTVAANSSSTLTYTVTLVSPLPAGTASITNTATSSVGSCPSCTVTNPTASTLVTTKAVTTVNGTAATAATPVKAGDVIRYTVTVANAGGSAGTTTLSDPVPANTTYSGTAEGWSCPSGSAAGTACTQAVTVPANASVAKTYTVTVVTPLPAGTQTITNTVTTSAGTCPTCTVSNPTPAVLDTVKTVTSVNGAAATQATQVKAGDVIVYTVTVSNTGGTAATTTLSDPVPAATSYAGSNEGWSCAAGATATTACTQTVTVPANSSVTRTYTVQVANPVPAGTTAVTNVVTSSTGTCSSCTVVNPTVAALDTVKSVVTVNGTAATAATQLKAGDVVDYSIKVSNTGGSGGSTLLSDTVPTATTYTGTGQGWSCPAGSAAGTACTQSVTVPAGGSVTRPYTLTLVTPLPAGTQTVSNTVTTSSGTCSACTVTNPTGSTLDTVKSIVTVNGTAATPGTQVGAGDILVYAIKVSNNGGATGTTTLTDPVPAGTSYTGTGEGWSCPVNSAAGTSCTQAVAVPANGSVTKQYTVTVVNPRPAGRDSITNVVSSSVGTCSACSVSNPTTAGLDTVKSIVSVNGNPATTATQVTAGDVIVYSVKVSNDGGSAGTTLLTDQVPVNTTYTGIGQSWSCAAGSPAGTSCTQSVTVGPLASATLFYTVTVVTPLPAGTRSLTNTVTTSTGTCSSCAVTNPTPPVLATVKTLTSVNGAPATAATAVKSGDVVIYAVAVTNTGGSTGTTVASDPVPTNTSYTGTGQGWSCPTGSAAGTACTQSLTVAAGATATAAYTLTVVTPLPAGTQTVANVVTTSVGTCSPCTVVNPTVPVLDTVKAVVTVNGAPATQTTQLTAGDVVVYSITVANTGGSAGSTVLSDPVPANTAYTGTGQGWSCPTGAAAGTACTQSVTVAANSSTTVDDTLTVANPLPAGTQTVANTVTSSVGTCSACSVTNPTVPVLATTKAVATVNGAAATTGTQVKAGDVIVYTITVANSGGSAGSTTLSDPVPANTAYTGSGQGWSCPTGSAAGTACTQSVTAPANGSAARSYTVTVVTPLPAGTQTVANVVTSSAGTCSTCTVSNPTVPSLSTVKAIVTVNGNPATAATQVGAGDVIAYRLTVTNVGGSAGTTVLSDPVPATTGYVGSGQGWSCATGSAAGTACTQTVVVPANSSQVLAYTVAVVNPLPAGVQSVTNLATSSVGTCAPCSVTNPTVPSLDTVKSVVTVNGAAATAATQVQAGDVIVYSIAVSNTGGSAGSTVLSDPVPANTAYTGTGQGWSCPTGSVAGTACTQSLTAGAGATTVAAYTLTVNTPLPAGVQTVANVVGSSIGTCSACTVSNPTVPSLNTVKTIVTVDGSAATPGTQVRGGDVVVYSIVVSNTGGAAGTTVLSDPVPADTTYSGTGEGWSCATGSAAGTACTQTVTVPANTTVTRAYTLTVITLPPGAQSITNTASTSAGTCSSCSVTNPTVPDLSTTKSVVSVNGTAATAATQVKAGDVIVYSITVVNGGGSTGTTVLSDPVPANTAYTGSAQGWSCPINAAAGTACGQTVTITANTTLVVAYTVTVVSPLPGGTRTIANAVTSSVGLCAACSVSNPTVPSLDTVKRVATVNGAAATPTTQVKAGDVIVYTVTVTNTGGAAGSTTLSDPVPANTAYTGTGQGWSCPAGSAAGTACTQSVTVGSNASVSRSYTLTVVTPLPKSVQDITNVVSTSAGTCSLCSAQNPTIPDIDTVKVVSTVNGVQASTGTPLKAGDVVVYAITSTNTGGSDGTTVLSDPVPANTTYTGSGEGWSCPAGAVGGTACGQTVLVPNNAAVNLTYTVTVVTPLPARTQTIANQVASSVGTCSSCSVSNPTVPVLDTVKTVSTVNGAAATAATPVKSGDVIVYSLVVSNSGGTAGRTVLSDPVPANTTYTGTGENWSCPTGSPAGTACTQTVTAPLSGSARVTYTVTVATPLPAGTRAVANLVTPSVGTCSACNPSNPTVPSLDTVKTIVSVNGAPATTATQVKAGDVITYELLTSNTGGSSGSTVLTDPVPANTTFSGIPAQGWSCPAGSAAGTACTHPVTVSSGSAVGYFYRVTVNTPLPGGTATIANLATSSAGTCSACTVTNPTVPSLDTVKTVATVNGVAASSATQLEAGDVVGYTITVANIGGSAGTTTLSDAVPANTTYSGAAAQGWSCAVGAAAGTACTRPVTVGANTSATVAFTVTLTSPLPTGTQTITNSVASSTGTCSACTVSNPTAPILDTVKTVATVNGEPATTATAVKAGDVVGYTISVTNSGGSAGTTTLSDAVPANTTYSGAAAQGWSCAAGSAAGTACTQPVTVAANAAVTVAFTVTITTPLPTGTQTLVNTVTSSTGTCSACTVSNPTVPSLDTVKTIATINGTAAFPTSQLHPGDVVVYTVRVTNSGGTSGTTTLSDPVPANTTYTGAVAQGWSCAAGSVAGTACTVAVTVPADDAVSVSYTVTVVTPLPAGTADITNTVTTSSGTCSACSVTNPTVSDLVTIKTLTTVNGIIAGPTTPIAAGDVLVYTIRVSNAGGSAGTTTLSDPVPANTRFTGPITQGWSCASGAPAGTGCLREVTVPADGAVDAPITLTVVTPLPAGTQTVGNVVTSSNGSCPSCSPVNPTVPALATSKVISTVGGRPATAATQVKAGDVVVYTITTTNTGGSTGTTTLVDTVPTHTRYTGTAQGWSCPAGSPAGTACRQVVTVGPRASMSEAYTLTIDALPAGTTTVANLVTSSNGTCTACRAVNPTVGTLSVAKSVSTVNGRPATEQTPVVAGDLVVYVIVAVNTGGAAVTTTLTDAVPAHATYAGVGEGWSCAAGSAAATPCTQTVVVPADGMLTRIFTMRVAQPLPAGTVTIGNTVTSSAGTCTACSPVNPTGPALDTVKTIATVNGSAATTATRLSGGDVVGYTITVTNGGGSAGSTTLTDAVPAGTHYTGTGQGWSCPAGAAAGIACTQPVTVPAAGSVSRTFTVTIDSPVSGTRRTVDNTVTSSTGTCSACTVSNPLAVADVTVVKTVDRATVPVNTQVQFSVQVGNLGPDPATAVTLTDIPTGLVFVSATVTQGSYVPSSGVWAVGTLASGAQAVLTITETVTAAHAYNAATVVNPAEFDPNLANNRSQADVVTTHPVLVYTGIPLAAQLELAFLLLLGGAAVVLVSRRRRRGEL